MKTHRDHESAVNFFVAHRRFSGVGIGVIALLFLFGCAAHTTLNDGSIPLTILHYNDFHSQNLPFTVSMTDNLGNKSAYTVGGLAMLEGYINNFKAQSKNPILLHAGDDFQGSPVCTITKGRSQIELLNLVQPDVMTFGNHEFDYGADLLRSYLPELRYKVLSANIWDASTGKTYVPAYDTLSRDGFVIGIIGLAPKELLGLTMPENAKNLRMLNTDSVARHAIADLRARYGAKLIIALSHLGVEDDSILATTVSGIDIIVGGHSHTALMHPMTVNHTLIVQAGSRGRWLGRLDLVIDRNTGTILSSDGDLTEVRESGISPDPVVAAKVSELEKLVDVKFKEVIGTLETDWTRSHGREESNIGNWQADVIRDFAKTDIGFQNTGGIRKDLPAGPITVRDIWEISPFDNEVSTFSVTGAQLYTMIAYQIRTSREYCQVSGLRYTADVTPSGDIQLTITINNTPLDRSAVYTIATNSYTAGHLRDAFGIDDNAVTVRGISSGKPCRDIFIDAIRAQKIISSKLEGRITIAQGK
jgi:2',3'-cyclic-nucleotide 2'-phosphodiesterase (5'-nucleotidase family)